MTPTITPSPQLSLQQRKQLLILQGQVFRAEVAHAQHELFASLEPKAVLSKLVAEVAGSGRDAARQLFGATSLLEGRLGYLLPLAGTTYSFLARRHLLRPALLTLAAGLASWIAYRTLNKPATSATGLAEDGTQPDPAQVS